MTHAAPMPCCDTVLYVVIGRAAPHPIKSWPHDDPDIDDLVASAKNSARTKAEAAGHVVSFILVPGTGPIAPIDIDTMVAKKVAEAMAALPVLKPATLEDDNA